MRRIESIEDNLKSIQTKMDQGANDWTKEDKIAIKESYFEITKQSTGVGRNVDTGCPECVMSAVNIIKNYQALVARAEAEGSQEAPSVADWKESIKTIEAKAEEVGFEIPKSAKTKTLKIEALEAFLLTLEVEDEEEAEEEDLLGEQSEFDKLAEIVKAKTGETVTPEEISLEDLKEYVEELNAETDENSTEA